MRRSIEILWLCAPVLFVGHVAVGQHHDVLLQSDGAKIVVGSANFTAFSWTIGSRVFARDFDSDYLIDNPGYNALSDSSPFLPSGYVSLPGSSLVSWDFLPMIVDSGVANLLYWSGQDTDTNGVDVTDVEFVKQPGYSLTLEGAMETVAADGSAQLITGGVLAVTDSDGSLHYHREYELDDGDLNAGTSPTDGIYLVALQVRMDALNTSDPFVLVFGTPGSTLAARNSAVAWVEQSLNMPGDYNRDGIVGAADYTVWRDTLDQEGIGLAADGNGDQIVDAIDYGLWKSNFGTTADLRFQLPSGTGSSTVASIVSVPEPTSGVGCLAAALLIASRVWRRRARHGLGSARRRC